MRIPLDYYRILSVPIQAVDRQLEQAYSDRLQQQPRREFNDRAIEARQALIRKAYEVLSDSEKRAEYDAQFLVNMEPVELLAVTEENQGNSEESEAGVGGTQVVSEGINSTTEPGDAERTEINSAIEIPSSQLVGALLIMQELGEYELVLTQGIEYYNSE